MIHVDRSRVAPPEFLTSKSALDDLTKAHQHFRSKVASLEARFQFKRRAWLHPSVNEGLDELFHGKCAFCESKIVNTGRLEIDHFRPKYGAADLDGNYFPGHYYWLAHDWRNIYASCQRCLISKKNLFPIAGKRAPLGARYEKLGGEEPLLIDPCNDRPGMLLVFDESGRVGSGDRRGKMTIQIYDLNREALVERRARNAEFFKELFDVLLTKDNRPKSRSRKRLLAMISDAAEFAGMQRQFFMQRMERMKPVPKRLQPLVKEYEKFSEFHRGRSLRAQRTTIKEQKTFTSSLEDYTLDEEKTTDRFYLQDLRIRRIVVRNVKTLQDLDIELSEGVEAAPWTVLLGENGCGKSTLLQALAMALVGNKYRDQLAIDTRPFVRNHRRVRSGSISVYLKSFDKPLTLHFGRTSARATVARRRGYLVETPKVPVLGYGAMRLLPKHGPGRTSKRAARLSRYARVGNLFDPSSPLTDATAWLLSLHKSNSIRYKHVLRSLRYLLGLGPRSVVRANHSKKRIEIPSLKAVSLDQLSDGYQSLLAVSVDIMSVMLHHFEAMESAMGVVLIDELGAHLHPRWRMRIIERLRTTFPWVQFIVSTHDPLCLRGTHDGEVIVLRKDDRNSTYALTDLPSVAGLRVDQLLTSEHFGLSSTIDPSTEALFERYYALLREPELTTKQRDEVRALEQELESYRLLGETRRERIMLRAIDDHLARTRERDSQTKREKARRRLSARLENILSDPNV